MWKQDNPGATSGSHEEANAEQIMSIRKSNMSPQLEICPFMKFGIKTRHTLAALFVLLAVFNSVSYSAGASPVESTTPSDTEAVHKGTVLSSFDEDGYTYIKYQDRNAVSWVAVLQVPVKEKDVIEFPDTQPLLNYQSRTLKEPFEKIIFASDIKISEQDKPAPTTSEESTSDKADISTQGEIPADKPVSTVTEEVKAEKPADPKDEVKKSDIHIGKVISSMNTIGYSYIEYEEDGVVSWVAVAETPVNAGDVIEFPDTPILKKFGSKSLKKTFERLYMASELRILPKKSGDQNHIR